jgi:16S rRNA (uracil1498-N3)-methyltransferase
MSGSIRLFVRAPLFAGAQIEATEAQAHYLGRVMRRAAGDALWLFNGADGEWEATIALLHRVRGRFMVTVQRRAQRPEPDLWLVFAPLKRDATDHLVQKATELGASALLPVQTERTNAARINPERLAAIATEAAEQCERLTVPRIASLRPLGAVLADWPRQRRLVAALERSDAPRVRAEAGPAALLVGPEGGFSPAELDALQRHPLVIAASLGVRVLRAETAAIVGLALLQAGSDG